MFFATKDDYCLNPPLIVLVSSRALRGHPRRTGKITKPEELAERDGGCAISRRGGTGLEGVVVKILDGMGRLV